MVSNRKARLLLGAPVKDHGWQVDYRISNRRWARVHVVTGKIVFTLSKESAAQKRNRKRWARECAK